MSEKRVDQFIIDSTLWSFSRLNSFSNGCRYEWYEHYIRGRKPKDNFFSQYGSFVHQILESYAKEEMGLFELADYYTEHFSDAVSCRAPKNKYTDIKQSYFDKGLAYFNNFDMDLDKYEILGVEKEVRFKLDGHDFVGFIDLLLRDKETQEITILDHKSASIKILKNGSISKSDQPHFREFIRQLMLYSKPVMEEYGRVDFLEWNMFKDQNHIRIPWTAEDYDEATKWAIDTIHKIEEETVWNPKPDQFFCKNLCGLDFCEYR